ncbi:unnamed protein product [Ambrosiozyma monospora]|uniref:Unnamed protein product n=1 Tax=Ambrosiozyma monospora TaxID=43982 RepID=A0A9W6YSE0_AMBMO|nr:unnamed protein product [Ambrosiozyma monospora]
MSSNKMFDTRPKIFDSGDAKFSSGLEFDCQWPSGFPYFGLGTGDESDGRLSRSSTQVKKGGDSPLTPQRVLQWTSSVFGAPEYNMPGCTVTLGDFSKDRFRYDRRNIFSRTAYTQLKSESEFSEFPNYLSRRLPLGSEELFAESFKTSCKNFKRSLANKPYWSDFRWVNVNGIDPDAFYSIVDQFKLHPSGVKSMLTSWDDDYNIYKFGNQVFFKMTLVYSTQDQKLAEETQQGKADLVNRVMNFFTQEDETEPTTNKPTSFACEDCSPIDLNFLISSLQKSRDFLYSPSVSMKNGSLLTENGYKLSKETVWMVLVDPMTVITFSEHNGGFIETDIGLDTLEHLQFNKKTNMDSSVIFTSVVEHCSRLIDHTIHVYSELILSYKTQSFAICTEKDMKKLHFLKDELLQLKKCISRLGCTINELAAFTFIDNSPESKSMTKQFCNKVKALEFTADEMLQSIDNLVNLRSNLLSVKNHHSITDISTLNLFFLPLLFWTTYFGMGFGHFNILESQGEGYFWKIAVPFALLIVVLVHWKTTYMVSKKSKQLVSNNSNAQLQLNNSLCFLKDGMRGLKNNLKTIVRKPPPPPASKFPIRTTSLKSVAAPPNTNSITIERKAPPPPKTPSLVLKSKQSSTVTIKEEREKEEEAANEFHDDEPTLNYMRTSALPQLLSPIPTLPKIQMPAAAATKRSSNNSDSSSFYRKSIQLDLPTTRWSRLMRDSILSPVTPLQECQSVVKLD